MKSKSILIYAILLSTPIFAQTLPDEINYPTYEQGLQTISQKVANAEAQLSSTRADREEALKFIREMTSHIADLEIHIRQSEAQIASNQKEIPQLALRVTELKREQVQVSEQLKKLQAEEQKHLARHQQELTILRPLEAVVERKEQMIAELEQNLARSQQQEREVIARLNQADSQIKVLQGQLDSERASKQTLSEQLRRIEAWLPQQQNVISQLQGQHRELSARSAAESQKLVALNARIQETNNEINSVRSQGQAQDNEAQRRLSEVVARRDASVKEARRIEQELGGKDIQLQNFRARAQELRRDLQAFPAKIAGHRQAIAQLESGIAGVRPGLQQEQQKLGALNTRVQAAQQELNAARAQASSNDQVREAERRLAEAVSGREATLNEARKLEQELSSKETQLRTLRARAEELRKAREAFPARISQLEASIAQIETAVAGARATLATESQKHAALVKRVEEYQKELAALQAQNAPADQIKDLERKVNAATRTRDSTAVEVSKLEAQVKNSAQEIQNQKMLIENTRRDQQNSDSQIEAQLALVAQAEPQVAAVARALAEVKQRAQSMGPRIQELEVALNAVRARSVEQVRELERKLSEVTTARDNSTRSVAQLEAQLKNLERDLQVQVTALGSLSRDQQQMESLLTAQLSHISQLEPQVAALNQVLGVERQRVQNMNAQVQQFENELNVVRARIADQVRDVERKLQALVGTRDNTATGLKQIEAQFRTVDADLRTQIAELEEGRRDQRDLSAKITQSDTRERQMQNDLQSSRNNLSRLEGELAQIQRSINTQGQTLSSAQQDLEGEIEKVKTQIAVIEGLDNVIDGVQAQINSTASKLSSVEGQISSSLQRSKDLTVQIPQLQNGIKQAQQEITKGKTDMLSASRDEQTLAVEISKQVAIVTKLQTEKNLAQSEFNQRRSLYNRYLQESKDLGLAEGQIGTELGRPEGKRLADVLARKNGVSVGSDLGLSEARYWAVVRGEVEGHEAGYADGMASEPDRSRGDEEGRIEGKKLAHLEAQKNLKPGFFEEHVLEEFKRPVTLISGLKSLKSLSISRIALMSMNESLNETIPPLTAVEIENSDRLITALDGLVPKLISDHKAMNAKARLLSSAETTFEVPAQLPTVTPNCSKVYKELPVFTTTCQANFKIIFANLYQKEVRRNYLAEYTPNYERELVDAQINKREASFPGEYKEATKVSHAQGLKEGKTDNHEQSYARGYKEGHENEVPVAREKARMDAGNELKEFLKVKPLLTLAESSITGQIRAGEEVDLIVKIKNVALAPLDGPAIIRITSIENAEASIQEAVLYKAAAQSITNMPTIKLKILSTAMVGQKLKIKGTVSLPGDLYKPQRLEKFEITETLSVNPTHDLALEYDKAPKVKGIFRRNIHSLTVALTPKYENISEGYKVILTPVGAAASMMEITGATQATGAIGRGQSKEMKMSYTFTNEARGKVLMLEMSVVFGKDVIKKEKIELKPR